MKKSNLVTTHELIEFAYEKKYNISHWKDNNNKRWNDLVDEIDFDNQALGECGSFDINNNWIEDCETKEDGSLTYQGQIFEAFMKKNKIKEFVLIND